MEKSRITALVDGIFAVAMTLLVLDLKLPEGIKMNTDAELWRQLAALRGHFLIYALSFVVLGTYWVGNHFQFNFVRKVDRGFLWLNLLFLLFITLLPFSTNLLGGSHDLHIPVVVYGINVLLLSLILLVSLRYLTQRPELCHEGLTPSLVADSYRRLLLVDWVVWLRLRFLFILRELLFGFSWLSISSLLAGSEFEIYATSKIRQGQFSVKVLLTTPSAVDSEQDFDLCVGPYFVNRSYTV